MKWNKWKHVPYVSDCNILPQHNVNYLVFLLYIQIHLLFILFLKLEMSDSIETKTSGVNLPVVPKIREVNFIVYELC